MGFWSSYQEMSEQIHCQQPGWLDLALQLLIRGLPGAS